VDSSSQESVVCYSVISTSVMVFGSVAALDAAMASGSPEGLSRAEKLALGAIIACKTVDPETFWSAWAIVKLSPEGFEEGVARGVELAAAELENYKDG